MFLNSTRSIDQSLREMSSHADSFPLYFAVDLSKSYFEDPQKGVEYHEQNYKIFHTSKMKMF